MINIFILSDSSVYADELFNTLISYEEPYIEKYFVEKYTDEKELYKNIKKLMPQIIIIHESAKKLIRKILNRYPFIPIIVYGKFDKEKNIKKILKLGVTSCVKIPFNKENLLPVIKQTVWQSLAKQDLWNTQMSIADSDNRIKFILTAVTYVASLAIVVGLVNVISHTSVREKLYYIPFLKWITTGPLYVQSYNTQYNNPTGIALDKTKYLWICDWQTQNIYKHIINKNFVVEKVFSFPETRFSAITLNEPEQNYIFSCDPWTKKIYKHDINENMKIISTYNSPGPSPTGIACFNKTIWVCDNSTAKIYQLDENCNIIKQYDAPGPNPVSICYDIENCLWSADSQTNKIYKHKLDEKLSVENVIVPPEYIKLTSIAVDKNYLWICSEKEKKIYKYPKSLLVMK